MCGSTGTSKGNFDAHRQDWNGIPPGLAVEVLLPGGFTFHGTVDAKTAESCVVWIRSDAGLRQMFGHLEGVRLEPRTPTS